MKIVTRSLVIAALAVLTVIQVGQARSANSVSFANLDPAAGLLDVYIDGVKVYESLAYGMVTSYYQVGSNRTLKISFRSTGGATPVIEEAVALGTGGYYTAVAYGNAGGPALVFVADTLSPGGAQAGVRLVNLTAVALTTEIGGLALGDWVTPGGVSEYVELEGISAAAVLRAGEVARPLLTVPVAAYSPGSNYTLFVTALPDGGLDAVLVQDVVDRGNF
jgi:hypothetical protein